MSLSHRVAALEEASGGTNLTIVHLRGGFGAGNPAARVAACYDGLVVYKEPYEDQPTFEARMIAEAQAVGATYICFDMNLIDDMAYLQDDMHRSFDPSKPPEDAAL